MWVSTHIYNGLMNIAVYRYQPFAYLMRSLFKGNYHGMCHLKSAFDRRVWKNSPRSHCYTPSIRSSTLYPLAFSLSLSLAWLLNIRLLEVAVRVSFHLCFRTTYTWSVNLDFNERSQLFRLAWLWVWLLKDWWDVQLKYWPSNGISWMNYWRRIKSTYRIRWCCCCVWERVWMARFILYRR